MFWKRRVYLDRAAGISGNPSSPHEEGREARRVLEDARTAIARLIEAQADDIIFTSGATEANALAILGTLRAAKKRFKRPHALYLPSAHASVIENMKMASEEGIDVESLPITDRRVDIATLEGMLRRETVLVSMDAVCGETGVIWNMREVARVLKEAHHPALLHVDASQAPLSEKITRAHFEADLLTLDGSKVTDVRGIGALVVHRTTELLPLYRGGGQERELRPGSEAPELVRRFAQGLLQAAQSREKFRAAAEGERARLVEKIKKTIPNVYINERSLIGAQAPHILNISLIGRDTDYLVALLDEEGFTVSSRSACETDSQEGSRAVKALFDDTERARTTLRISWGPDVRPHDLDRFATALLQAAAFVDSHAAR